MFAAPPEISTRIFARLPDSLRYEGRETPWSRARRVPPMHSFLEGPSFDRDGNLYCVDICHGRIFRISPAGQWTVFAEYDGGPNGLKIHEDGRIFVADCLQGLLCFDAVTGTRTVVAAGFEGVPFNALNDLVFADNGDLYFTDPGNSSYDDRSGRIFRMRPDGTLNLVLDGLPYPNGLVLNAEQNTLFVALTRSLQILRCPLDENGRAYKCGVFVQMSGGLAGPDGMAFDEAGNLAVVHAGFGSVWLFDHLGEPMARIRSCTQIRVTNVAFGGPNRRDLFITEAGEGAILTASLPHPGRRMFSHA